MCRGFAQHGIIAVGCRSRWERPRQAGWLAALRSSERSDFVRRTYTVGGSHVGCADGMLFSSRRPHGGVARRPCFAIRCDVAANRTMAIPSHRPLSVLLLLIPAWPMLTRRLPIYLRPGHLSSTHSSVLQPLPCRWAFLRLVPHLYGGMFLSGEGEHGPYHPLHLLLYRCLPLDMAFTLEAFLHVPILFAGLFVFLRRYVRDTAALLGAICYTFCSGSILHNIYPNYQGVIAQLPWICCCWMWPRRPRPRRATAGAVGRGLADRIATAAGIAAGRCPFRCSRKGYSCVFSPGIGVRAGRSGRAGSSRTCWD